MSSQRELYKIDTSIIGEQKIIYSKDGYVKTRTINIIKDDRFDEKKIIFKLKNDELVIINQDDNYIDVCRHPKMVVIMDVPNRLSKYDMMRIKVIDKNSIL